VMGVDDIQLAAFVNPGLSTIRHDLHQVGIEACNRMLQLIKGEIEECSDLLPTSLVVRGSTARMRGK
ncbi:MAG: substrate-binding domain-containing protein, partial [Kiritimatiellia bacterium]